MGAGELNYSSDIDLICLFDETRYPGDEQEARAAFIRVARRMTAILSDVTDGYVFRTDLRLRPDASVIARSPASQDFPALGLAMMFISHDLSVVRYLCERVVIMRGGEIVEEGATADVFANPRTSFTRTLIASIPLPQVQPGWLDETPA